MSEPAAPSARARAAFLRRLRAELPPSARLVEQPEELAVYECDGLMAKRTRPWLVVLPSSVEEARLVMRLCHLHRIPLVPRGAGTGLSGGAMPHAFGVLLNLARLRRILEVDADACLARVEPGVTNLAISRRVAPLGLYYAPDPSSQLVCTLGGNVAENAGGVHCLKYGLTLHNVQSLKLLTADGELLELGGAGLEASGYDLLALLVGSEGLLGMIVEVTVRLLPRPPEVRVLLAAFNEVTAAGDAVGRIIAAGLIPSGLEMMDGPAIRAAEDFAAAGYPRQAAAILLCELDGMAEEVAAATARVEALLRADPACFDLQEARTEADRARLWRGRKSAFPAMGRISPDYYCMDGTVPRRALGEVLAETARLAERHGLSVANVFHAGDGNLHPLILYDSSRPGDDEKAEALGAAILELCVAAGGTITGEHGVGVEKLDQMCVQFGEAELDDFHAVKRAFDPAGIMNPGKAVPSLHRCAEFGAMHVHGGRLPHPEVPRF